MRNTETRRLLIPAMVLVLALPAGLLRGSEPAAAEEGLKTTFGRDGLASLSYRGKELLAAGPAWASYKFSKPDGSPATFWENKDKDRKGDGGTITRHYQDLTAVTFLRQEKDTLRLEVRFENARDRALRDIVFRPFSLVFPRRPKGAAWKWAYTVLTSNVGEPGVVVADWGEAKLAACCDEVERPVTFGFEGHFGNGGPNPLSIGLDKLGPGEKRVHRFSLRFGGPAADPLEMAGDIYQQFAKACPDKLNWPDRRPIGALFLCRAASKWTANPRGWFNDERLNVVTPSGRQAFHDRLMRYAQRSIAILKDAGAQGMILWDPEGQQMPHAISYLGDPRIVPRAAPEMDAVIDEFFQKFRAAGLKVGVCIRPSRIVPDGKGGWAHVQVEDHVAELADKIAYAKRRWGCTIFYMDTNFTWEKGMWQGKGRLLPSADLRKLTDLHPGVLIFPEFGRFGYWGCCMPYGELRGGYERTSDAIHAVYPNAGSTVSVGDGDYLGHWDGLLKGVVGGDIHLFRGWLGDPVNQQMKRLYQEADYVRRARTAPAAERPLAEALAASDPLTRWAAVNRVKAGDKEAVAVILTLLRKEQDWVVQKRMVEVLGASADAAAVPALVPLVRDRAGGLDPFAAAALGQLGTLAEGALLALADDQDPTVAVQAIVALGQIGTPKALPLLLELADSRRPAVRRAAIRALGGHRAPQSLAKLLSLLGETDKGLLIAACGGLGRQKDKAAVKPLLELIERSARRLHDDDVRVAAGDALEAITGLEYGPYERAWQAAYRAGRL
jgi:HEAT repeat protein